MAQRNRLPAPRTLAAPPLPSLRPPETSHYTARFPSLVALLAGGMLIPACESPQCGDTRGEELRNHGERGADKLREGRAAEAIREIGVATGLVAHGRTTVPDIEVAGAAPAVYPTPVIATPPQVEAPPEVPSLAEGQGTVVTPSPASPTTPPAAVSPHNSSPRRGGVRSITPRPAPPAQPPARPQGAQRGDMVRVGPAPANLTTARLRTS